MATDRIAITVTERDIERAHKNDSYKCVVAQALARTIKTATRIEVDTQTIRFTDEDGRRRVYLTPYAVQGYVIAFDAGDQIQPFSFRLEKPIPGIRTRRRTPAGNAGQRARDRAKRAQKRLSAPHEQTDATTSPAALDPREAYQAITAGAGPLSTGRGRKAPPRVFRKKQRTYGHRLLRINQKARQSEAGAAASE